MESRENQNSRKNFWRQEENQTKTKQRENWRRTPLTLRRVFISLKKSRRDKFSDTSYQSD